jgi:hypothetical protein
MENYLQFCKSEQQLRYLQAVIDQGSNRKAAEHLGINRRTLDRVIETVKKHAAVQMYSPDHDMPYSLPPGFNAKRVSIYRAATPDAPAQWNIGVADTAYQTEMMRQFIESLIEDLNSARPPKRIEIPVIASSGKHRANFFMVGDAHLGMRAYSKETLNDNHDTNIGINDLYNAFQHLISVSPDCQVGYLVNVGDLFHANDLSARTPGHNNDLDVDGRFGDVIDNALMLFCYVIELMLSKFPEVKIINARGNHDPEAARWFSRLVAARWHHEPRVDVLNNDSKFINFSYGRNFISIHHGDRIKRQQWYEAMTRDFRQMFGEALYTYGWSGHIHHKDAHEIGGCLFESFNVLPPPDEWHAANGYGANREMQSIIMSEQHGILGRNVCPIALAREYEYVL